MSVVGDIGVGMGKTLHPGAEHDQRHEEHNDVKGPIKESGAIDDVMRVGDQGEEEVVPSTGQVLEPDADDCEKGETEVTIIVDIGEEMTLRPTALFDEEFARLDEAGTGELGTDELTTALQNYVGLKLLLEIVEGMIAQFDTDMSGTTNLREFRRMWQEVTMIDGSGHSDARP